MVHRYPTPMEITSRIAELNKMIKSASKGERAKLVSERTELANARAQMQPAKYHKKKAYKDGVTYDVGVSAPLQGGAPGLGKRS